VVAAESGTRYAGSAIPTQPTTTMTPHRFVSLLALGVTATSATLSPRPTSAQVIIVAATQLSNHAWLKSDCADMTCIRNAVQNSFTLTFVPVGASADLFERAEAFVASADLAAFMADCPACKVNNRPFMIPPGLLFQLAKDHGNGTMDSRNGKSKLTGSADDGDNDAVVAIGGGSVSIVMPAVGGAGASNSAGVVGKAAALASAPVDVTTNPEPATLVLMATGLFGLVPLLRRKRRDR
jgi:hypothetical protein